MTDLITAAKRKISPDQRSPLHHVIQIVNDHNHTTNVAKDGTVMKKPTHGIKGK
jgi:hypothetical protein